MRKVIPPKDIPSDLLARYTAEGVTPVFEDYRDDSQQTGPRLFTKEVLEEFAERVSRKETNYYRKTDVWLYQALEDFPLSGKSVVVFGSRTPWYESIALHYGATSVTVIEYSPIESEDDRIRFLHVDDLDESHSFDCGLSISSFEHDGLGRYGDPLDPDGDFKAMKLAKEVLRPGGLFFLAVPVGPDALVWNAHRIYGRRRLPQLLDGWNQVKSFGLAEKLYEIKEGTYTQPVFVLERE